MKTEREPCQCHDCIVAGVSTRPQRLDPRDGWLHGLALSRWYQARDRFRTAARAAVGAKGRHVNGFEQLVGFKEKERS